MNKKILSALAIGLALIVVALMIARVKSRHSETVLNSGAVSSTGTTTKTSPAFGQYLKAARIGYRAQLEQDSKIPKECLDFFDALQKIDFVGNEVDNMTYQMLPPSPQNCVGEFVVGYTSVQEDYFKTCVPTENLSEVISEACTTAVFLMRAAVTRVALKNKSLSEISDLTQLTDLVFSEMAGKFGKENMPDFTKMKAISARMLEVDPNLYAAHKVDVMSNMMEAFMSKKDNPLQTEEAWKNTELALAKAKEQKPNDQSLADAEIAIKTRGFDPVNSLNYSREMITQNPENDRGWYLMAFAQWKQGDRSSSIGNLKKAISISPNNREYQKILKEITKPNATGESFAGALSIGLSTDDFIH